MKNIVFYRHAILLLIKKPANLFNAKQTPPTTVNLD